MKLDIGCGAKKQEGYIGVDFIKHEGVDIVCDLEEFPWPFEDNSIREVRAWHILEHIERRKFFDAKGGPCVMSEVWRILEPNGLFHVGAPWGLTIQYIQDPTHCNPVIDRTFYYFDPRSPLWEFYKPTCKFSAIHLIRDTVNGNFELMMVKNV